jgi:hypothetical protein
VAARPTLVMLVFLGVTVPPTMGHVQDIPGSMRFETVPVRARLVDALRVLGVSGSPMIQWGWEYAYYINTGMSWGTRTGGSHEILEPFFPDKAIFVADYLESLESGRAPVFLDTATEGATYYKDSALYGYEQVPEVAEAVRRDYFPCAQFQGASLYLHRKRYEGRAEIQAWCAGLPHWRPPT